MSRKNPSFVRLCTLLMLAAVAPAQGAEELPLALGDLHTKGTVDIRSGSRALALSNSSYAYFRGEQIATRSDTGATLTLWGGAVVLGPDTSARVTGERGQYRIALERGAVRMLFESSSRFEVEIADVRIRPAAMGAAEPQTQLDLLVAIEDDGRINVLSQRGEFEAEDARSTSEVIADGQWKTLTPDGLLISTQAADRAIRPVGAEGKRLSTAAIRTAGAVLVAGEVYLATAVLLADDSSSASP